MNITNRLKMQSRERVRMVNAIKINYTTTIQLLKRAVQQAPDKEAIYDGFRRITYRKLDEESTMIAAELRKLGIEKGDHVAVSLPNWHEFIVLIFAIAKAGAVIVPFNTRYREAEVAYILNNSKAKIAFYTDEVDGNNQGKMFNNIFNRSKYLQHLITVRGNGKESLSYENLLKSGMNNKPIEDLPEIDAEDLAIIMYTSGTTGNPKGAMLTHKNVTFNAFSKVDILECTQDDVFLIQVPMFHIFGMVPGVMTAVACKAKIVLTQKFKAEKALQIVEQEKVTVHHGVPTMFILELNHPSLEKYDLSSLRTGIVAAAPIPSEIIGKIREKMNCEVLSSYGMTEASPSLTFCTFQDDDKTRAETVGRPIPGVEIKLLHQETGKEVGIGEVGEIVAKGPGIMKGYYGMPEKTKEVLSDDGWYKTGDLGMFDPEGNLRIVGRKKDLIIRGGYNIYPREIEEFFYQLDDVLEVAIVGLPDTVLGEISCAAVTVKENSALTEESLKNFIQDKVADYKVPDIIVIVKELPMTASGKISKVKLQEVLKEKLAQRLR